MRCGSPWMGTGGLTAEIAERSASTRPPRPLGRGHAIAQLIGILNSPPTAAIGILRKEALPCFPVAIRRRPNDGFQFSSLLPDGGVV